MIAVAWRRVAEVTNVVLFVTETTKIVILN